jgi:hypothetical protein
MSFDARSKERLEALGRTLPKKLPLPETPGSTKARPGEPQALGSQTVQEPRGAGQAARHRLEREQDPAELFRALISASPDGSVPPHLLDRLREVESSQLPAPPVAPSTPSPGKTLKASGSPANRRGGRKPGQVRGGEEQDLYTAFAQLLLEDEGD